MIAIETTIEISTSICGDIAITAAEGGIGYWAQIQSYKFERWAPDYPSNEVPDDFVFYTILENTSDGEWDWDDPEVKTFDITPELIARGIGLAMKVRHLETDLSAMDADEADQVIQYGCFGEVVYG